jgi:7-cyano-7-deazaguanine synthase
MKALVLLSGGIDSTTCLALAVSKYTTKNVIALSITYGQKHNKELQKAMEVAKYYNIEHYTLNLEEIFKFSNCSLLKHSDEEIPLKSYSEQIQSTNGEPVSTYVPFRNGLFLSSAASFALSENCDIIYYGAHSDDSAGNAYPDCSEKFNNAMNEAIYEGSGKKLKIEAPFVKMNKADVIKLGIELKVPYQLTWSCYIGDEKPCGKCGTCIDRENAFKENNILDPIL